MTDYRLRGRLYKSVRFLPRMNGFCRGLLCYGVFGNGSFRSEEFTKLKFFKEYIVYDSTYILHQRLQKL